MSIVSKNLVPLLNGVSHGNEDSFKRLVEDTSDSLYSVTLTILRDTRLARAALIETYRCVWREVAFVDFTLTKPSVWLISIARRTALTTLAVNAETSIGEPVPNERPLQQLPQIWNAESLQLHDTLNRLPPGQAEIVRNCYLYGVNYSHLCHLTGESTAAIRDWLRAGIRTLKDVKRRA